MFAPSRGCFLYFLFLLRTTIAAKVNRTIDDTYGDPATGIMPTYLPQTGSWANASCAGCMIKADPNVAYDGSWTAATYHSGSVAIELPFTGTAIYVFFILPNISAVGVTTAAACNFTLDGQLAGNYSHPPASSIYFTYNTLVFSQTNLQNVGHMLNITISGIDYPVFISFDYAIYTYDDGTSSSAASSAQTQSALSSVAGATTSIPTQLAGGGSITSTSNASHTINGGGTSGTSYSPTDGANLGSQTDSASSNAQSSSSTILAAAVGGSAGAAVVFLLLLFLFYRRRKRNIARAKTFPLFPVPFNRDQSLPTDRPASEFFPTNIDSTYYSPGKGSHRGPFLSSSTKEGFRTMTPPPEATMITSPLSILRRDEDDSTYSFPLQPMRHSEASRQLQEHMETQEIRRPVISNGSQHAHTRRQPQSLWVGVGESEEPPPEYSS